jgi:hypothetical protein
VIVFYTAVRADRPLLKRDVLNVCCLPAGSHVQFGYRKDWIQESLWEEPSRLNGEGLIIFCEKESATAWQYHLVRKVTVSNPRKLDDTLTLDLVLGRFPDYKNRAPDIALRTAEYVARHKRRPGPDVQKALFVCDGAAWPEPDDKDFRDGWRALALYMSSKVGLSDSVFFSVQRRGASDGPDKPIPLFDADAGAQTLVVPGGSDYRVLLHVLWGRNAIARALDLSVGNGIASIAGPFRRQRSEGEEAEFHVSFRRSLQGEVAGLSLRAVGDPGSPEVFSPELYVDVKLSVGKAAIAWTVGLVTVGTAISSIVPEQIKGFSDPGWANDHAGPLSLAFKVLGSAMLLWGAWRGFSKLPIKAE